MAGAGCYPNLDFLIHSSLIAAYSSLTLRIVKLEYMKFTKTPSFC